MKNVIFDLGGVLIEWSPARILESYYADPESRTAMHGALFAHPDWLQMDRGTLSEAEVLRRLERRTGRSAAELEGLLDAVRSSLHVKADTLALVERLAERGVPLFCLSNMSSGTFRYLRQRYTFWGAFRGVVISGDMRMMKPERESFEFVLHQYGLDATKTIFVDDVAANVAGARSLGMRAVRFTDAVQCGRAIEELLATD